LLLCVQCRAQVHWWCFVCCHRLDHCLHFTIMCLPRVLSHLQ
jgi:lysozyme family protein